MTKGKLSITSSLYAESGRDIERILSSEWNPRNALKVELNAATQDSIAYKIVDTSNPRALADRFDALETYCEDRGLMLPHYDVVGNRILILRRNE